MPFVFKRLALIILSITTVWAADKHTAFQAQPATSYPARQTNQKITIAADPYVDTDKLKAAFGKLDPNEYGVLPVLLVMQNDSGQALRLSNMQVQYMGPNRERIDATPAREVRYLRPPQRPNMIGGPPGTKIKVIRTKKNPLDAWEVEGRAFAAQMLPAGNSASGFFYFQTTLRPGATIYVSGIAEAATGKELLYFEIPLP